MTMKYEKHLYVNKIRDVFHFTINMIFNIYKHFTLFDNKTKRY